MSDIKSPKQVANNTKENLTSKLKLFLKGYEAPKSLIIFCVAVLTASLILSAFALWSSNLR